MVSFCSANVLQGCAPAWPHYSATKNTSRSFMFDQRMVNVLLGQQGVYKFSLLYQTKTDIGFRRNRQLGKASMLEKRT